VVDEETGEPRVTGEEPDEETKRLLHRTIAAVREEFAGMRYNTAGAKLIELNNHVTKRYGAGAPRSVAEPMVLMLAPLCPHIAEELWSRLGHQESLVHGPFPVADERYLVDDTKEYPIQVNGKVRSRMTVPVEATNDELTAAALADEKIAALVDGGQPRRVIVVRDKLVNVVL
jgi:leucyl-tRNA synthetase